MSLPSRAAVHHPHNRSVAALRFRREYTSDCPEYRRALADKERDQESLRDRVLNRHLQWAATFERLGLGAAKHPNRPIHRRESCQTPEGFQPVESPIIPRLNTAMSFFRL